jgi:hypothetical protein
LQSSTRSSKQYSASARLLGDGHQVEGRFDDGAEGPLGPDDQFREVQHAVAVVVLVDHLLEVVAGDAAVEVGVAVGNLLGVVLDEPADGPVDVGLAVVASDDGVPLGGVEDDLAGVQQRPVREHEFQFVDVGVRDAVPDGVCARGVVPDAATDGRPVGRRGVGRELQAVLGEDGVEVVLDDARLDGHALPLRVDVEHVVHVLAQVEHHAPGADCLPRERGPRAPREHRHVVVGRDADCRPYVVDVLGEDDPGRPGAVDAAVGRVQHLRVLVELYVAIDGVAQVRREVGGGRRIRVVVAASALGGVERAAVGGVVYRHTGQTVSR